MGDTQLSSVHQNRRQARDAHRQRSNFQRLISAVIAVLVLVVLGLAWIGITQGPRLKSAQVNPTAVITHSNQRLILQLNQAIDEVTVNDVQVEPAAEFTVETAGSSIVLSFTKPLDYATEYLVRVESVHSQASGVSTEVSYAFRTPDPQFMTLVRQPGDAGSAGDDDQILLQSFSAAITNRVIVEAPAIAEYASIGPVVAATVFEDDELQLRLYNTHIGNEARVPIEADLLTGLRGSSAQHLIGIIGTVYGSDLLEAPSNTLYFLDLEDTSGIPYPVRGFDGNNLNVVDWRFVPGTTSAVVQTDERQLYLVDALADATPQPLGSHETLQGFLPGSTQLVVTDPDGSALLDLSTGAVNPLPIASQPESETELSAGRFQLIDAEDYVQLYNFIGTGPSGNYVGSVLYRVSGESATELFRPALESDRVAELCISPNRRYLVVEVVGQAAEFDGYPISPAFTPTTTYLINIETGQNVRSVSGFSSNWCHL